MTDNAIDVTFDVDEITLVGHLRVPSGAAEGSMPARVFTGPFTGVKERVAGGYAPRLAERGFATLAFDHRNFGGSGGHRRQHEDANGKLVDESGSCSGSGGAKLSYVRRRQNRVAW